MLSNKIIKSILNFHKKSNNLAKNNIGDIKYDYYLDKVNVSTIIYNNNTGELKYIVVNDELKGNGLGKYMLNECIEDIKKNGNNIIYCYSYDGHPFWSNVYNKKFKFTNSYDYKSASTLDYDESYGIYEMKI